jgi:hypothetical protein
MDRVEADDEEDEVEENIEEEEDDGFNWPEKAFHPEDYFGYLFDAGGHRICEFGKSYVGQM